MFRIEVKLIVIGILLFALQAAGQAAQIGPMSVYFITAANAGSPGSIIAEIQGNLVLAKFNQTDQGLQFPLAVVDTVRTLGQQNGITGAEY